MQPVTNEDLATFVKSKKQVEIAERQVEIESQRIVSEFGPLHYSEETDTVWSFPDRGNWGTHDGKYRGNWSPYIPRNLIEKYTNPGDLVLDQMAGSGTTLVESKLLGRDAIGVDINREAVMIARDRLNFSLAIDGQRNPRIETYVGDARNLDSIKSNSVDLVATHPPYAGIIAYTKSSVPGDLSSLDLEEYLVEMKAVANEAFRVLKPGKICGILIGDTRRHLHYIPISLKVLATFLSAGFYLKEDIIKLQHNTVAGRERWRGKKYDFYKIAHEHLYILRKPNADENVSRLKYSGRWLFEC